MLDRYRTVNVTTQSEHVDARLRAFVAVRALMLASMWDRINGQRKILSCFNEEHIRLALEGL